MTTLAFCRFSTILNKLLHCAQATVRKLDVSDSSVYTVSPPRIWGTLPRLAGHLSIEQTGVLLEQESGIGFMVSVELSGAEAEGFQAEPGNFIRRYLHAADHLINIAMTAATAACKLSGHSSAFHKCIDESCLFAG